uniref:Transcriptional regulator ycf27 n=1 Tax=Attheya septentrionalis TaxID=420275 RepID=A0A7S2UPD1_9STRA|mmetsp:Transcript_7013/g.12581  ORF Transcript_7013/g.12581 Transcript_7013/m.12581 type:complete len:330 (+) Transcript_7013:70-1059(+)
MITRKMNRLFLVLFQPLFLLTLWHNVPTDAFTLLSTRKRPFSIHHLIPSSVHSERLWEMRPTISRRRTSSTSCVSASRKNGQEADYKWNDPRFVERTKHWVVIVDDEEAIRMAVGDYLYDEGYQVTACADAEALLEVCDKPKAEGELPAVPDAIVSDIRMPGTDGLELLGWIRSHERLARVPVILLTAKSMTADRIQGYRAGADAYLPKPFDPEELLSIVDNAIRRRKQMMGDRGQLVDLKTDMGNIKQLLKQNSQNKVKATTVYITPAELQALELLSEGLSNGEIADARGVSIIGVNRMIQNLYLKTITRTRTELVRWAIETGHISPR